MVCSTVPSTFWTRSPTVIFSIRAKNENDEVDIYTYVTEDTFDSYLYQLVESKQKFIGQIMTSKSPARSVEDIDETALSYAEIKALFCYAAFRAAARLRRVLSVLCWVCIFWAQGLQYFATAEPGVNSAPQHWHRLGERGAA